MDGRAGGDPALAGPPAAAADLQGVGNEAAVGANGTGEACRLRVVQDEPGRGSQRLSFYCDGWSTPSGTLFRFRVSREFTPERILTDSTFQRGYEARLGGCGPVEATTLGDGTAAAIRQCTRLEGGWPVVVVAAVAAGRGVALETFPTNVRLLEAALAAFQGKGLPGAARHGDAVGGHPARRDDRRRLRQAGRHPGHRRGRGAVATGPAAVPLRQLRRRRGDVRAAAGDPRARARGRTGRAGRRS